MPGTGADGIMMGGMGTAAALLVLTGISGAKETKMVWRDHC